MKKKLIVIFFKSLEIVDQINFKIIICVRRESIAVIVYGSLEIAYALIDSIFVTFLYLARLSLASGYHNSNVPRRNFFNED